MQHLANILLQTTSGEKFVLAFKNLGGYSIISSFSRANTLMNVGVQHIRTSPVVSRNQSLLQCHFNRGASFIASQSFFTVRQTRTSTLCSDYRVGREMKKLKCSEGLSREEINALNRDFLISKVYYLFGNDEAHCGSKSCTEMTPVVQDTGSVIVIMGVCGAGKTTIGNLLAEAMNCVFLDADDFHPDSNKEKMRNGIPLSEEDRIPWLQTLCKALREIITAGNSAILACSALRNTYREILRSSDPDYVSGSHNSLVKFVLLDVPVDVLSDRLNKRMAKGGHFMPPVLLQSQLELLEFDVSEQILHVDATESPPNIIGKIQDLLSQS